MTFQHHIDNKTNFLVLFLDAQIKATRIAKILNMSLRTVQDWISKTNQNQDIRKVQKGRPKPTLTKDVKRKVYRRVREAPAKSSTHSLGAKFEVSSTHVHSLLKKRGLKYQSVNSKEELTEDQKDERIYFCEDMLEEDGQMIDETFFSDEMGIWLSDARIKKAWSGPEKKIKVEKPQRDVKLNCWGAISRQGATSLHIFKDNLTGSTYEDIIDEHIPEMEQLYPEGFYFQHDNSSVHQSAEGWMDEIDLERLIFNSYSPYLTPIENLWATLKYYVRCDAPSNETALHRSLIRNWEILTTRENLEPYFENLKDRYQECLEKNGERLPY